jgi:Anti-sigma-K factor rskA, C-terminal
MTIERRQHDHTDTHAEWKELCALSLTGALEPSEEESLREHLAGCVDCLLIYKQYQALAVDGMPFLAGLSEGAASSDPESAQWDAGPGRRRLFDEIDRTSAPSRAVVAQRREKPAGNFWRRAVASVLILGGGLGSYELGRRSIVVPSGPVQPAEKTAELQQATRQKVALDQQITSEMQRSTEMEKALATSKEQIAGLEASLKDLDSRSKSDQAALSADTARLQASQTERDNLAASLQAAQQTAASAQKELESLRQRRDQDLLHYASLEVAVSDLTGRLHEAEARDKSVTQYLASDRDIRELMGARQLYIADVMDVDRNGEKRKPFGRVFYTKGTSLIFYAFDLDRQPKIKDVASTSFQAWALEGSDNATPVSLGVFYVDSETNRRWVLKAEDPKVLAQINSVFVTVEPKGGSQKPSGKQLLYAYLRSASPNHP